MTAQIDMAEQVVEVVRSEAVKAGSIEDQVAQNYPRCVGVEHDVDRIVEAEECRRQRQE